MTGFYTKGLNGICQIRFRPFVFHIITSLLLIVAFFSFAQIGVMQQIDLYVINMAVRKIGPKLKTWGMLKRSVIASLLWNWRDWPGLNVINENRAMRILVTYMEDGWVVREMPGGKITRVIEVIGKEKVRKLKKGTVLYVGKKD
ncbi:hypothetical protein CK934_01440 [Chitinophaga sp. MD30]|nr:hypothetical protein CK934_01440 [Chitinophaga sp. MD30]